MASVLRRAVSAALLLALAPSAGAAEPEARLVLHHFLGPQSPLHVEFAVPWAEQVEQASGGRIEIDIFPAMALGGRPPDLYRQARDGTADIVWTLIGYTPGVFPRSEVFELPSVHRGSARATNVAIQEVYAGMLADDFSDVHPILVHAHGGNALHLGGDPVAGVEDLRGKKIRTPSRTGAWLIEEWGADPVGMPLPDLPQALSKGVVEGALIPFEVMAPMRVEEMTTQSLEGAARFGTSVFLFAMNKERYGALPDDLRAIIDAHSGPAIAEQVGVTWDAREPPGKQAQIDSGGALVTLTADAQAEFDRRSAAVEERWIRSADENGLDGKALVDAAKEAISLASR